MVFPFAKSGKARPLAPFRPIANPMPRWQVSAGCRWNGNVSVRNNTTGGVIVLPWNGSLWSVASGDGSLIRTSTTDNFSIVPA